MDIKKLKEENLQFNIYINNYGTELDEYGEYDCYNVILDKRMLISNKDRLNLIRELKDSYSLAEGEKSIEILDRGVIIGKIDFKILNKVLSLGYMISEMESYKGDAGVCACEIHLNKLYHKVKGRRLAYIHDIYLKDEYHLSFNEELVLRNVISFLKNVYRVSNIVARPIARELDENERYIHRYEYYLTEYLHYNLYRDNMSGYVMPYYPDIEKVMKALDNLNIVDLKKARSGYSNKVIKAQTPYINCGMKLISKEAGVLAII